MKHFIITAAMLLPIAASAMTPLWLRDVKIAPDGRNIAFTYKGDIYTVPVSGGQATRITTTPDAYETSPVWSHDSRRIAFAGDRYGSFDVFVVDANGGAPLRLTYNSASEIPEAFTPDGSEVMFSAAIQDPATSAMFPTGRMTELYAVAADASGAMRQVLATPARFVSWAPDGKSFIYQDVKGFEDEWRKHHTSSVTRDIWRYDIADGKHTNITNRGGEDIHPANAGDHIYFLSERDGGTMNVYRAAADGTELTRLTSMTTHPVRFLSRANDGRIVFGYDGEIYTMTDDNATPAKVAIDIIDDSMPEPVRLSVRSGARSAEVSPDGESVAFVYRGDVFVTSVEYGTTKQITSTPEAESQVRWSNDGKSLIFTSERDGKYNLYQATMARPDEELNFPSATLIDVKPLFDNDGHERTYARMSPDGKQLAYVLDRNKLMVRDMASGSERALTDGSTYRHRDGGFDFAWSPDSRWIALEIIDRKHDPYSDIAIINVADGSLTNITNSGYFDSTPHWALDGNAILFASERYGMRNHASWGSMFDAMIVFLNQDAFDRFNLSKEDLAIREKLEKKAKKDDDSKKTDKKDKKSKDADKKDAKDDTPKIIDVDLNDLEARTKRLTPMSTDLIDVILTDDGETLYYTMGTADGTQLWKLVLRGDDDHRMVRKLGSRAGLELSDDGKTIFVLGSSMGKLNPSSDKFTPITYSAQMWLDPAAEREFMFDNMVREERERFYVANMHGVDWDAMSQSYRRFLPHISNNYDFAEMLSEILGELNVSHTGGSYAHSPGANAARTASLGLLFDMNYDGKGLRVAEVVTGSPFDSATSKVKGGTVVTAINGTDIDNMGASLSTLLADAAGKKTLVSFSDGTTSWDEVVEPISSGAMRNLMYKRWVRRRAADVDSLSNGRLGYVHIESMDDESFRRVYSDLLGKYNDREGVVIDIRWNGGGRLHEDIEVLFSGKKYFTQEIRGVETCDMPSRRWNKPSIMVMSEACYSNAHGSPWVYKHQNIGKLVGMPVPGTMTSVNWVRMQDPSLVFGIPVIGYRLPDGSFLENQQLNPDIRVANDPAEIVTGRDAQLETAVRELLKQIDSAK